jgi:hypothetical protein
MNPLLVISSNIHVASIHITTKYGNGYSNLCHSLEDIRFRSALLQFCERWVILPRLWILEELDLKGWDCGVTEEDTWTLISVMNRMNHYVSKKDQKNPKFDDHGWAPNHRSTRSLPRGYDGEGEGWALCTLCLGIGKFKMDTLALVLVGLKQLHGIII